MNFRSMLSLHLVFGLLVLAPLAAADKKAKGASGEPRETVAKPLSEKEKRKRDEKLRKELETPFRKWLNEDVAYIITDEERTAFKRMTTDEEREQFIEQFWLRRDTTPGTPANEAKEEHYRRIAYANQRFAAPNRAGWATDRGRIYIQWGPPDEIESHPSGRAGSPPFETWRYHQIERIGKNLFITFIDFSRKGDYQVAPAPPVRL